jgi:integrase
MSKIYKPENSSYYHYVVVIGGSRIRRSTHQTNKKLAIEVKNHFDQQVAKYGLSAFKTGVTPESAIKRLLADYLDRFKVIAPSEDRISQVTRTLQMFNSFCEMRTIMALSQVDRNTADDFITYLIQERDYSPKYIRNLIQILRQCFDNFYERQLVDRNVFQFVKVPRGKQVRENRVLTDLDIYLILKHAGKYYHYYLLLLETGLRAADAAKIQIENVDINTKLATVFIHKTDTQYKITLSSVIINYITELKRVSGPLFPDLYHENDRKVSDRISTARKHMQRILSSHNRPKATLHSFRHTFNQMLAQNGISIGDRQVFLSHSSTATTKIYSHPDLTIQNRILTEHSNKVLHIVASHESEVEQK